MGLADGEVASTGDGASRRAVQASGRTGFAARGVLYTLVGVLALRLAAGAGAGAEEASQQGAMREVASRPFGGTLLAVLAVGLLGYAAFRLSQAVRGRGDGGAFSRRVVPAARAAVNAGLAGLAVQVLLGHQTTEESSVTAAILAMPGGSWLVAGVGLVIAAVGVRQLVEAWTGDTDDLTGPGQVPARRAGRAIAAAGYVGRGAVFLVVGGFLVRSAVRHDPESGVGLDAALQEVLEAPFGGLLLTGVAVGLILFGLHCFVEARYGR